MRIDYHVHTDNSLDCSTPMIEMCTRAMQLGLTEIAFTDHFNNHLLDLDLGFYDPRRYFEDIEYCRGRFPRLRILAGIELGEPHRWGRKIRPVLDQYKYDVVIGSLHWVGNQNVFSDNYFRPRTPQMAYREYFAELLKMVEAGGFDILAHVDLPKRIGFNYYGAFRIADYEQEMRAVWAACIRQGITPEINTKGLRIPVGQIHPTAEALAWYVEMGGRNLTFGSDAHHPDSVADGFDVARKAALQAGLTQVCRFEGRQIAGYAAL